MKILLHNQRRSREQGGILVVALIFGIICTVTLSSYLVLISQERREVNRSQDWNGALAMTEAGVDEALAQINASSSDFSANGWTKSGSTYGPVTRTLAGGSYSVSISTASGSPTIYSTGSVSVATTSQSVSRKVKVVVTSQLISPFSVGLGAVNNIDMNGNSIASDSWNSHSNRLSTNGMFSASMISSNGDIGSVQGIVNIGNQTILGSLFLGPNASYTSGTNQITGTIHDDYNIQFPDVTVPTVDTNGNTINWQSPPTTYTYSTNVTSSGKKPNITFTTNVTSTANSHTFTTSGYYLINDSADVTINPGVSVTMHVQTSTYNPANFNINGGTTNSGTAIVYQDSGSITLAGNAGGGAINNRPENLVIFGGTNVTQITLSGDSTFIGAIYAPEASLTLNGGGNSNNLEGAAIVNTVTMHGHYDFHYDLALANFILGTTRGYIPISWQEL